MWFPGPDCDVSIRLRGDLSPHPGQTYDANNGAIALQLVCLGSSDKGQGRKEEADPKQNPKAKGRGAP